VLPSGACKRYRRPLERHRVRAQQRIRTNNNAPAASEPGEAMQPN